LRSSCEYGLKKADNLAVDLDVDVKLKDLPRPYEFILYRKHSLIRFHFWSHWSLCLARREAVQSSKGSAKQSAQRVFNVLVSKAKNPAEITVDNDRVSVVSKKMKMWLKTKTAVCPPPRIFAVHICRHRLPTQCAVRPAPTIGLSSSMMLVNTVLSFASCSLH
jgi:hypothetical protein